MCVSSFDTVPPHQAERRPVCPHHFHKPGAGMPGRERNPLRLTGVDRQRVEPERLPSVIEPVQYTEMVTMKMEDRGGVTLVGEGQYDRASCFDPEGGPS